MMRQERRVLRTVELIQQGKEEDDQMVEAAIERSKNLDTTTVKGKYSIWRRDYENPNSDSTLKLMRDQIIMAKAYATIAKSKNNTSLYSVLMNHSRESRQVIGEASSDAELHSRYSRWGNYLCFLEFEHAVRFLSYMWLPSHSLSL